MGTLNRKKRQTEQRAAKMRDGRLAEIHPDLPSLWHSSSVRSAVLNWQSAKHGQRTEAHTSMMQAMRDASAQT